MKILVTGGTGFIGSHTTAELIRAGHEARLLVRSPEKAKRVYEALEIELPECVVGDVTDAASVASALEGCDGAFHAAALVALDAKSGAAVERTNFAGTRNVIGQAHDRGFEHIVYVSSTSALFDPDGGVIGPDSEPSAMAGSVYSASKTQTERWLRELQDSGAPVTATYPGGVLGPHAPALTELHRSLPLQVRMMLITEGGVNFIDVRDLAEIHVGVFARPPEAARWLAGGPLMTFPEFADLLEAATGRSIPRIRVPGAMLRGLGRVGDVASRFVQFDFPLSYEAMTTATCWPGVDSSRTLAELGVTFRDPGETLADTLAWMHQAGHLAADQVGRLADREPTA